MQPDVSVKVDVGSETVRYALQYVIATQGWDVHGDPERTIHVSDALTAAAARHDHLDVLVADASPAAGRWSIDALLAGTTKAIIDSGAPSSVVRAVDLLLHDVASVPLHLIDAAARMPGLGARSKEVLELVAQRRTNAFIARHLGLSTATVKREVAHLVATFDVRNRYELATVAKDLGAGHEP